MNQFKSIPRKSPALSVARLREVFNYDPETGIFTRRRSQPGIHAGAVAGHVKKDGFVAMMVDRVSESAHRLAWLYMTGENPIIPITHINGIKSDNRISNLQLGALRQHEKIARGALTHEAVVRLLDYSRETGFFHWKVAQNGGQYPVGMRAGTFRDKLGYRQIGIGGKHYKEHRLAWFYVHENWPASHIDHIDGNPSNNAIANLREATRSQNLANQKLSKRNRIGLKGVYPSGKRYRARKNIHGKIVSLGVFDTPQEAHKAYCHAAKEQYGEFARFE